MKSASPAASAPANARLRLSATKALVVYRIYVGGTWGKQTRMGTPLSRFVTRAEIEPLLEKTMLWFKENAMPKERLGKAIDRLGIEKFEHDVFSDDLLNRREEILTK